LRWYGGGKRRGQPLAGAHGEAQRCDTVDCAAMSSVPYITRFAPSPTGALHLGNARTALVNDLAARASGGRMVLRIEDTDAARTAPGLLQGLLDDLRWFGLDWAEGPDVGGSHGPYLQSLRGERYSAAVATLQAAGQAYPCFCSPEELKLSRKAQLAAGRPPRYAGTCAGLHPDEVAQRVAKGARPALRFRVPTDRVVEFLDVVHGPQSFSTRDIGDFVIRRADGGVAFFLGNALDDAAMGVTLVLRGDDHLANTPRQILLLEALGMKAPSYGHLPLLLGSDGAPLSKREGAASLREFREQGYLPGALRNYLARLGQACVHDGWLEADEMPRYFDVGRLSRSAPHFDEAQLRHWQREAVAQAGDDELLAWLGDRLASLGDAARARAFVAAVRGNLLFPTDADLLVAMVCEDELGLDCDAARAIAAAGADFFEEARSAWRSSGGEFRPWAKAIAKVTGRKGAQLYMPLRAALTGCTHGPELAPLVALMGADRVEARLRRAGVLATAA
jgi:glutamyl-tRNA synthetase